MSQLAQEPAAADPLLNMPHPVVAPMHELVARVEEIVIDRPLDIVIASAARTKLEDAVAKTSSLPSVADTRVLTAGEFGAEGSRRQVSLTDGSTLLEQVLEQSDPRFRYVVWNYSSPVARPIEYGVGLFERTSLPGNRTKVRWTYAFKLRSDRFPGYLGGLGKLLFRVSFLDRQYAAMMRATLQGQKAAAERFAGD